MLVKIFDTAINLQKLKEYKIIGEIKDEYFLSKIKKRSNPNPTDIFVHSNYSVMCLMSNNLKLEISTLSVQKANSIYRGLIYLKTLNDVELKAFIRKAIKTEPFYNTEVESSSDLSEVVFAKIIPKENSDLYFVYVVLTDGGATFSKSMSFSDCLKYLTNISLLSTYDKDEMIEYLINKKRNR